MATYTPITDAETSHLSPLTVSKERRWRDNPIAIAEGAAGAPRIEDGALGATVTAAGRSWVALRIASQPVHGVGTFALAIRPTGGGTGFGDVVAGSTLQASNINGYSSGVTLAGTWRCLGVLSTTTPAALGNTTLWQRIS